MNAEVYKLECVCGETVEIPTAAVRCPKCGASLEINWAALAAENPITEPMAARPFEHPAVVLRRAFERELARIEQVYGVPGAAA